MLNCSDDATTLTSCAHDVPIAIPSRAVVPRTFLGPFVLSALARAISFLIPSRIYDLPSHPMAVQFLIRLELLLLSWMAHARLSASIEGFFARKLQSASSGNAKRTHSTIPAAIGCYYLLITAAQFHMPFYSSRLLPNTFPCCTYPVPQGRDASLPLYYDSGNWPIPNATHGVRVQLSWGECPSKLSMMPLNYLPVWTRWKRLWSWSR